MSVPKITVQPEGFLARLADALMKPIMYCASGTRREQPQEGHFWNKQMLNEEIFQQLDREKLAVCEGWPSIGPRMVGCIPMMHLPVFGGWRDYVVLQPEEGDIAWHVGWHTFDRLSSRIRETCGVRKKVLHGAVRMLRAPEDTEFFGIAAEGERRGEQIAIKHIGSGRIGEGGPFAKLPLL